ncbi:hypothetical protein GGE16_006373 [Rhizobium leguminosarum]|uniref:Uncharacterized protein n=1 Tax=Rhizobium leguminosarum TaxID=384 RepID=A0AAE2MQU7_RHILE|nr:hypothetical protein [Rhizobium leguminosarum]MBB4436625.1 hypothetical protein [Rhizobium esperanzae]MBB4300930.1 hypothetical protein [Rhizobium leguminosarum]MBB4312079.1 hypothetical protein [Rhizobium leguminosarum]MBB4421362.1 hypothetical protein [Rhizobium leguminosarum]
MPFLIHSKTIVELESDGRPAPCGSYTKTEGFGLFLMSRS